MRYDARGMFQVIISSGVARHLYDLIIRFKSFFLVLVCQDYIVDNDKNAKILPFLNFFIVKKIFKEIFGIIFTPFDDLPTIGYRDDRC